MTIALLREAVREYTEGVVQRGVDFSEQPPLERKEIRIGIKKIYKDTGKFIELLNEFQDTGSFEVEKPNFSESGLPQPVIDFFETQYEFIPEEITFRIRAEQDSNKKHSVHLDLERRNYRVSFVSFRSYVRPRGKMAAYILTGLNYEEMQPVPTIEAGKAIYDLRHSGDTLIDDATDLRISRAILEFAINEAVKHVRSQATSPQP